MNRVTQRTLARRDVIRSGAASAVGFGLAAASAPALASAQGATPTAEAAAEQPGVTPERVATAIARLDNLARQTLEETGIPGLAIAVVYGDETPYLQGFGTREAGRDLPIDAETVFQLASVSKSISATLVAALVGDGVISWDSHISELMPEFQMLDPWVTSQVTLRDMFCHRSGLPDHAGDYLEDLGFDRDEILYRMRFIAPASSFRSAYAYTNFGLTAAAVAAAMAAGTTWEEVADRRLFQPLGMASSSFRFADFMATSNRALGHMKIDGAWTAHEQRQPDPEAPAGGASSNVRDLARWMHLQIDGGMFDGEQVVASAPLGETHTPQIVNKPPKNPATDRAGFYGLGWNVGYTDTGLVRIGHSGAFNLGAGTVVNIYPASRLGITVLTNAQPIGAAETLAAEFLDLAEYGEIRHDYRTMIAAAFAALIAPTYGTTVDYTSPPTSATPPLPGSAYVGTYRSDLYGDLIVEDDGNGLVMRLGPQLTAYPLTHYDRDIFWYQPPGENATGPSGVAFTIVPGAAAISVMLENLDTTHQGTFTRSFSGGEEP
ncbi:MAG: serine hydrolase [Thermomicrobiales bacterium]|nr:serine hydrolase [Thermomicrobiales bacterium]